VAALFLRKHFHSNAGRFANRPYNKTEIRWSPDRRIQNRIIKTDQSNPHPLWQRNYYEHVIRCENELNKIREYIVNNPMSWEMMRTSCPDSTSTIPTGKYL
jgi:REP element-mobilizing transposase RayT